MKHQLQQIIVSVTNDLATDQRVEKVCNFLIDEGYYVRLVGRKLPKSWLLEDRKFQQKRFRLWFNKGFLFYFNYNLRLFFYLLFAPKAILLSNDLDTLPANFLVAKIKALPLVYDSHEFFTEVPELLNRPFVKKIWELIESLTVPYIKWTYTVSNSIAEVYNKKYKQNFKVVRNLPRAKHGYLEKRERIIIYQGALNLGRGLEHLIQAMAEVEALLHIAGAGDIEEELKEMVKLLKLEKKVKFLGRIKAAELYNYTSKAKVGVSIEEPMGLNYQYALPNKLFDYIQAGVPVLVSNLPEMRAIVENYKVGKVIETHTPSLIAAKLNLMLADSYYENCLPNCKKAAAELNWENEKKILKSIFSQIV